MWRFFLRQTLLLKYITLWPEKQKYDDDDDDERRLALFPAGTIVRDPHHSESPTRREQNLNLRRTWIQT